MIYSSALTRGGAPAGGGRSGNVISKWKIRVLIIFTKKLFIPQTFFTRGSLKYIFFSYMLMTNIFRMIVCQWNIRKDSSLLYSDIGGVSLKHNCKSVRLIGHHIFLSAYLYIYLLIHIFNSMEPNLNLEASDTQNINQIWSHTFAYEQQIGSNVPAKRMIRGKTGTAVLSDL